MRAKSTLVITQHWATAIYHAELDIDNQALLDAMYSRQGPDNYPCGYTSYYDEYRLEEQPFLSLCEKILPHAREYMPAQKGRLAFDRTWFSIMHTGGRHPVHAHPGSYISGTYYPKTLGSILFHDPRVGAIASAVTRDPIIGYEAMAGRLVLFPSWLLHEVPVNLEPEDRLSFSFNIHDVS